MKSISKLFGISVALLGMLVACESNPSGELPSSDLVTPSSETSINVDESSSSSSSSVHVHNYGDLIPEVLPSYFYDGEKAHYHCVECDKYFDENKQEVTKESLKLERAGDSIAIALNNVQKGLLTLTEKDETHAVWVLNDIGANKNDVVSLTKPGDVTYKYAFFGNGNLDENNKILTAGNVDFNLVATPNGFMLDVSGYKYEGIVVKINDTEYPMNQVSYYDNDKQTYIYGYHNFAEGDKMVVIDNINNITYDYDDIEDDTKWNVFDFHKNSSNEFVFDKTGRYGIEFDRGGDKKISVTKTFGPNNGEAFQVAFDSERTAINMEKTTYAPTSDEYKESSWYINHEKVNNADDIRGAIANGLDLYLSTVTFETNEKFNIKNVTANKAISSEHLVAVYADDNVLTLDGDFIKILKGGKYEISYLPCQDAISVYAYSGPQADAYVYSGGNFIPVEINNDIIEYNNFHADQYDTISFTDGSYNGIEFTLATGYDATVFYASTSSGMTVLMIFKAGTFSVSLDLSTHVLTVTIIELDGQGQQEVAPKYLSGKGGLFKTLTDNPENNNEVYATGVSVTGAEDGFYIAFYDTDMNSISDITLDADSATYGSVMISTMIYITQNGTYNVYIQKTSHVVRLVKTA